jgi:hypothetical protein
MRCQSLFLALWLPLVDCLGLVFRAYLDLLAQAQPALPQLLLKAGAVSVLLAAVELLEFLVLVLAL